MRQIFDVLDHSRDGRQARIPSCHAHFLDRPRRSRYNRRMAFILALILLIAIVGYVDSGLPWPRPPGPSQ